MHVADIVSKTEQCVVACAFPLRFIEFCQRSHRQMLPFRVWQRFGHIAPLVVLVAASSLSAALVSSGHPQRNVVKSSIPQTPGQALNEQFQFPARIIGRRETSSWL